MVSQWSAKRYALWGWLLAWAVKECGARRQVQLWMEMPNVKFSANVKKSSEKLFTTITSTKMIMSQFWNGNHALVNWNSGMLFFFTFQPHQSHVFHRTHVLARTLLWLSWRFAEILEQSGQSPSGANTKDMSETTTSDQPVSEIQTNKYEEIQTHKYRNTDAKLSKWSVVKLRNN